MKHHMELLDEFEEKTGRIVVDARNTGKPTGVTGAKQEEKDPYGRKPFEPGAKLDAGKPSLYRGAIDYFPRAIDAVARVSTFGAKKYDWKGWETVPEGFERYSDAMVRHLIAEGKGEVLDSDSGLLHAAHAAWNALARLELKLRKIEDNA